MALTPTKKTYKGSSDKPALESKKFWAFMITLMSLDVLTGLGMFLWLPLDQWSTIVLLSFIVVMGVVSVGYIIGTVGLDALTHLFDTITPDKIFGNRTTTTTSDKATVVETVTIKNENTPVPSDPPAPGA